MKISFIKVSYYEIEDEDFTGVIVKVFNNQQQHVATITNFDIESYQKDKVCENQTDSFEINMLDGYLLFSKNPGFKVTYKAPIIGNSLKERGIQG